jgi:hypothetical protein
MKFIATAEHTQGKSVAHHCRRGVYSDPTDGFQVEITADSIHDAMQLAHDDLREIVDDCRDCWCERRLSPGSDSWWESIAIALWPQDAAAFAAWRADHDEDQIYDPYGLIPEALYK